MNVLGDKKTRAPAAGGSAGDRQNTSGLRMNKAGKAGQTERSAQSCSGGRRKYHAHRTLPPVPDSTLTTAECHPPIRSDVGLSWNEPAVQRSNNAHMLVGDEGGHRQRHPMDDFDDLLRAFDDLIDGESRSTKGVGSRTYKRAAACPQGAPTSVLRPARRSTQGTSDNDSSSRLFPRLDDSRPATVERQQEKPSVGSSRRGVGRMGRVMSRSMSSEGRYHPQRCFAVPSFPIASSQHHDDDRREKNESHFLPCGALREKGGDDAFDLMLQSKEQNRQACNNTCYWTDHYGSNSGAFLGLSSLEETYYGSNSGTVLGRSSAQKTNYDSTQPDGAGDTSNSGGHHVGDGSGGGETTPQAGVFRISHPGAGFVHYGYTWDIGGAKEDQLRRLNRPVGTSEAHPHKGLSAIVQRHHDPQARLVGRREWGAQSSSQLDRLGITFEVVSRVRLPSRFRADEFEETMKNAYERELSHRRHRCLLHMARCYYRRKHCAPALRCLRTVCRQQAEDEGNAAAAEIQRVWRGCRGRMLGRLEHKQHGQRVDHARRERVRKTVAIWGQAMHRGRKGRQRAAGVKEDDNRVSEEQRATDRAVGVTIIQAWFRRCNMKRKEDGPVFGSDEEFPLGNFPTKTLMAGKGGAVKNASSRPITPSEIRIAGDLDKASLSLLPDRTPSQHRHLGAAGEPAHADDIKSAQNGGIDDSDGQQQRRPRPSSSREARDRSQRLERPPFGTSRGRENRRPSSAGFENARRGSGGGAALKFRQVDSDGKPSVAVSATRDAGLTGGASLDPDASRLVLEGDPHFAAAAQVQAVWRGFVARLGLRRKRRAAAALRRKREGKWRQQRGVVGKQVSRHLAKWRQKILFAKVPCTRCPWLETGSCPTQFFSIYKGQGDPVSFNFISVPWEE